MNEPLNTFTPEVAFKGKTYNKHPQWYNEPLRLTKEQNHDPFLVLTEFFECYQLNEIREILWQWTSSIISSPGVISIEPLERSNHLYFYEKIEEFIEAGFILKKKIQKHRRKQEKRKLKNSDSIKNDQNADLKKAVSKSEPSLLEANGHIGEIFNKEKRLIEYADEVPLYVINEVFTTQGEFTSNQLMAWLQIALTADYNAYEHSEDREQLKNFHDDLVSLTDALYVIYSNNVEKIEGEKPNPYAYEITVLSGDQIANPENTVRAFFKRYPRTYIDRELEDWLAAGICYTGKWPNDLFCHAQLLDVHRCVLCLLRSAEKLLLCNDFSIGIS